MKLWIGRDRTGKLYLYQQEPTLNGNYFYDNDSWEIDEENFPEVTFENSPQKVELKLSSTGLDRGRRDSIVRGLKQLEHDYMLSYEVEIDWLNKLVENDN